MGREARTAGEEAWETQRCPHLRGDRVSRVQPGFLEAESAVSLLRIGWDTGRPGPGHQGPTLPPTPTLPPWTWNRLQDKAGHKPSDRAMGLPWGREWQRDVRTSPPPYIPAGPVPTGPLGSAHIWTRLLAAAAAGQGGGTRSPRKKTILWSLVRSYTASTPSRCRGRPRQKRCICAGCSDTRCRSRVSRQKYLPGDREGLDRAGQRPRPHPSPAADL